MKKIIVTGNCGKSTLSYFLAEQLSKNNRVILVSTDTEKGMYSCFFPKEKKEKKSLGKLLSDPVVTKQDIYDNAYLINKKCLMISYAENEKFSDYPEITEINCTKFFVTMSSLADVLIVDSSNHIFDKFILSSPNTINISVNSSDMRGFHYRLKNGNGDINVLCETSPYSNNQDVLSTYKEKPIELPYIKTLSAVYNGVSIKEITLNSAYKKATEKIANEVINEQ